jgi:hypothetical protein
MLGLLGRTGVFISLRVDATLDYLPIPSCTELALEPITSAHKRLDLIASCKRECRARIMSTFPTF